MTNEITLLESDMERFIKFDKGDFVGREATLQQKDKGLATRLVYFDLDSSESDVRGRERPGINTNQRTILLFTSLCRYDSLTRK